MSAPCHVRARLRSTPLPQLLCVRPGASSAHTAAKRRVDHHHVASRPRVVFAFTIEGDRITAIDLLADPETLAGLDLEVLDD